MSLPAIRSFLEMPESVAQQVTACLELMSGVPANKNNVDAILYKLKKDGEFVVREKHVFALTICTEILGRRKRLEDEQLAGCMTLVLLEKNERCRFHSRT